MIAGFGLVGASMRLRRHEDQALAARSSRAGTWKRRRLESRRRSYSAVSMRAHVRKRAVLTVICKGFEIG